MAKRSKSNLVNIILVAIIFAVGFGGGTYYYQNYKAKQEKQQLEQEIVKQNEKITDLEQKTTEKSQTTKNSAEIKSTKGNITVTSPKEGAKLTNSVTITGFANVFEATFAARLKDATGKVIGQVTITAEAGAPEGGNYTATLKFTQVSKTQNGTLEVYDVSEKDGAIDDIATVKVTLIGK